MAIITLTSDWGDTDYYPAAVKGRILRELPEAVIVDVTHKIPPFDSSRAAYILRNAYSNFPKGSIHIIGINTEENLETPHVIALYDGHYFIGADDGIFSLIFQSEAENMVLMDVLQDNGSFTFSSRDRFAKAALLLAQGKPIDELGSPYPEMVRKIQFEPTSNHEGIRGMVIHIDPYENIITNIPQQLFQEVVGEKKFRLSFKEYEINQLSEGYNDVGKGELLCIFGSNHLLQIAINRGNAASLLGVKETNPVYISLRDA